MSHQPLPVAVIGAGPAGLTAAAHLAVRHIPFIVLEAGAAAGAAVDAWAHVKMFSPWKYTIDATAADLLADTGWQRPADSALPSGGDLLADYIRPLSKHPRIAPHVRLNARVKSVARKDMDKVRSQGREQRPFELRLQDGSVVIARAVIDASGTWSSPNPIGSSGLPAAGEELCADRIAYGIPDVLNRVRTRYENRTVAVAGTGHSAFNVILDLLTLAQTEPRTKVVWLVRRDSLDRIWGGGSSDALEARGELGTRARAAVESGQLEVHLSFHATAIDRADRGRIALTSADGDRDRVVEADEVVVCTGFRPDLQMLREVRINLDPWLECPSTLGPLIDPNEHSCGTVRPHGARELAHPEKDFYIVGMKSYGRAPTFLLASGYEQVRSVVAMLDGDLAAAERVQLDLPETGVCGTDAVTGAAGCCGGPAPVGVDACCADDAAAKTAGAEGCGCGTGVSVIQITRR